MNTDVYVILYLNKTEQTISYPNKSYSRKARGGLPLDESINLIQAH